MILGVAGLVAFGCGDSDGADSSCISSVRWNHTVYLGHAMKAPQGGVLGRGVVPACTPDGDDEQVTIRRIANVQPALAVAREGEPPGRNVIYLAPGFFPLLADHPLHRALTRQARGLPRPRRCSGRFRLAGAVLRTPTTDGVSLLAGGHRLSLNVVSTTRITGFLRAGHPYLQRRDLVDVRGRRCNLPDHYRAHVADVVKPAH